MNSYTKYIFIYSASNNYYNNAHTHTQSRQLPTTSVYVHTYILYVGVYIHHN